MDQVRVQESVDPNKWRARTTSRPVIMFFSSITFKPLIKTPEAVDGNVVDVITAITRNRILLLGLAPDWEGYEALSTAKLLAWQSWKIPPFLQTLTKA